MKRISLLASALLYLIGPAIAQAKKSRPANSQWVYYSTTGKLAYKTTSTGDRIMDFSHAGYMGGGVALPTVPVKRLVKPSGQDDTELIQAAINEVSRMPLVNGLRGAVQLSPGIFTCSGTLFLHASGVVLRGGGTGKGGSTIRMTGKKHAAIVIGKRMVDTDTNDQQVEREKEMTATVQTTITDPYVPAGTMTITVADTKAFVVNDIIAIKKPVTTAWVHAMEMDNLKRDGKPQTWLGTNRSMTLQRTITGIQGNQLTLNVPVSDALDNKLLTPPGISVSKITPPPVVTQVGVEDLHIQCPPLESSYGNAPYAGIRIGGDDCWVKNVYCEETMNTIATTGNRITIRQTRVTHTYPNLGASKPGDFSIEGTQILLDRCEATGGNTYFVWTSSLISGPNVMLNCTFRGHGSHIQPHQRWATGLLVDNCTIMDGRIDFMNRGVAGSGHGWTMGWGVVWNSIANAYIIQQPPGAANWAIGNIGKREQTARLFDSEPVLPEGFFDSHGKPVDPQSLYLAQLRQRLGPQALTNIGYASNSAALFTNKKIKPTAPQKKAPDQQLGADLALFRPVNTSSVKDKDQRYSGEKAVDADNTTYWTTNGNADRSTLEIDMEGPVTIDACDLVEAVGQENVEAYKVEGQVNSDWLLLAEGTTIGSRKIHQFPAAEVWKVRLTVLKAKGAPAIQKMGLYRAKK